MTEKFRLSIQKSLSDQNLQSALDANAEKRISVRQKAFASLPDSQALRSRARDVRADVIAHLDRYLAQFVYNLQAHNIHVHRASNAEHAVRIILEIAQQAGARLVAKSKTMVSEEIGLNYALEKTGLRVVETDLGEFIVQIRHEPPSHIITPAVHLRREDVGHTFHEVLGIPYTDDISTMTAAARRTLREVFLTADLGISGVNFGVAETGTLCIVTNEGNGRMVTTLPRVHVALMGMERLVPSLDDLALMLSLLPRSATGQKLSVYTNLINTPRREGDPDGPDQRHLILVDNGRSKIQHSPLSEILYCIRCGACLNACPIFREIGGHAYVGKSGRHSSYPGPMGSVLSPALFGQEEYGQLARASTLCGACKEACPVSIDLPGLLLRVRAGEVHDEIQPEYSRTQTSMRSQVKPNAPPGLALALRFFTWIAVSPMRFRSAQKMAGWFGRFGSAVNIKNPQAQRKWLRLPAITGWGLGKDFPAPATRSFHQRWANVERPVNPPHEKSRREVSPDVSERETTLPELSPVEMFASELAALGANFAVCLEEEVADVILDTLSELKTNRILTWSQEKLPVTLLERLSHAGIEIIYPTGEMKSDCSHVRVGLTGVEAAVAESGSLLVPGGDGQPLTASLLPEFHIAILRERDLYKHLSDVLTSQAVSQASAAVLISGPSRTADIEMTLTIGVHGPGELLVICIRENS